MIFKTIRQGLILVSLAIYCFSLSAKDLNNQAADIDVKAVLDDTALMLEQVDPRMAEEMKNLSPEQKKQLEQQLGVVFEKMSELSPEELQRMEQNPAELFDFVEKTVGQQEQPEKPEPVQPEPEKTDRISPAPKKDTVPQSAITKARDLLEKLTLSIETLLVKIDTMQLEPKIERWAEQQKIRYWPRSFSAAHLKEALLNLVKKLRIIKNEVDPTTKKSVYLAKFSNDENLFNALENLQTTSEQTLRTLPKAPASLENRLLEKITPATKQALISLITAYTEALFSLSIENQINTLIKTYEPRAKEIQAEEKTARERALKEKKLPQGKSGHASPAYNGSALNYDAPFYDDAFDNYDDYMGNYYGGSPSYGPSTYNDKTGQPSKKGSSAPGGKTGTKKAPAAKESAEKNGITRDIFPQEKKQKTEQQVEQLIPEIRFQLRDSAQRIESSADILGQLPDKLNQPLEKSRERDLSALTKSLNQAKRLISSASKSIKLLTTSQQNTFKEDIQKAYDTHADLFEKSAQKIMTKKEPLESILQQDATQTPQTTRQPALADEQEQAAPVIEQADKKQLVKELFALHAELTDLKKTVEAVPGKLPQKKTETSPETGAAPPQ